MITPSLARRKLGKIKRESILKLSVSVPIVLGASNFFYIKGAFREEQRAVASGTSRHYISERRFANRMFMRRSVHRIEKGLVSVPRRETFAADYIERTVSTVKRLSLRGEHDDPAELKWASDVLRRYFDATEASTDRRVVLAREAWRSVCDSSISTLDEPELVPFVRTGLEELDTKCNALVDIAQHRRSVRWFEDRPVPRALVEKAVRVGLTAPSACNRQSFRLLIIDDENLRKTVAAVPMGTAGFANQIPAVAVLIGQHRGYEHERDRHAIYVDGGLFTTGFILALEGLGLNSCCINWPEVRSRNDQLGKLIHLESDERVIMFIAIGYGTPDQLVPRSHKRSIETVVEWR
ncbi:nitroreductase family protein [Rhodococcus sp. JS3073]|uniref:nitroreductase family protein n=1 Tax=Rhodococcus sp. JS3073 TaxID=3002901 RepID=UPI002285A511|nr:nitroreductase family protein [Rhodococcus sp. JS3073]WAM16834.1 nitroreductase family protein [Rhodococcus sp. JS3073]